MIGVVSEPKRVKLRAKPQLITIKTIMNESSAKCKLIHIRELNKSLSVSPKSIITDYFTDIKSLRTLFTIF